MHNKLIVLDKETTDKLIQDSLARIRSKENEKILRDFETKVIPFLEKLEELSKQL